MYLMRYNTAIHKNTQNYNYNYKFLVSHFVVTHMTLIRIKTRHRQVFSKWWNSNTPSNIGLQFYSVSTTVMKSFCKKPLLDVVLKSQVVVRFLRYWSKKGIMYHVLNFMSQYCYHSVLALQPRNTMLSLLEEATMDWWLQVTLQDVGWRLLCWRGGMFLVRSD